MEKQGSPIWSPAEEEQAWGRWGLRWAPHLGAEEAPAEENKKQRPERGGRKPEERGERQVEVCGEGWRVSGSRGSFRSRKRRSRQDLKRSFGFSKKKKGSW